MTKKRFVEQNLENHLNKIYDNQKGKVVFDEGICDLLNELHEENECLKQKLCELGISDVKCYKKRIDTGLEESL